MNAIAPPSLTSARDLANTSQLLLRHLDRLEGARLLVVNPPRDGLTLLLRQRFPDAKVVVFGHDYAAHQHLCRAHDGAGLGTDDLHFGPVYTPPELHDVAVVFLPKGRALVEMTLSMVAACTLLGGSVFLVGENHAGIRSYRATLESCIGRVRSSDAARHGVLYRACLDTQPAPFRLDDWRVEFTVVARGQSVRVVSLPGVFSHGCLDDGTRLLLDTLDGPPGETALDFGCGSGVIGAAVKARWPEVEVDLVDTNALALEATHRTLAANGLSARHVGASDVFSDVPGTYAAIVSNPPFHNGIKTDYRVVAAFVQQAARHLEEGGTLRIVANRFLKVAPLLAAQVGPCRIVAENGRYRVYEAMREIKQGQGGER